MDVIKKIQKKFFFEKMMILAFEAIVQCIIAHYCTIFADYCRLWQIVADYCTLLPIIALFFPFLPHCEILTWAFEMSS